MLCTPRVNNDSDLKSILTKLLHVRQYGESNRLFGSHFLVMSAYV